MNTPKICLHFKRSFDSTILGKANSYLRYFSSVRVRGQRVYYCGFHFWINEMAVGLRKGGGRTEPKSIPEVAKTRFIG